MEKCVDNRIQEYKQNPSGLARLSGSLVYGMASDSRTEQIQRGMEAYTARRMEQQEIKAAIDALEQRNC